MKKQTINHSTVLNFCEQVSYQKGTIVSKGIIDEKTGRISLFAFAKGEKLSPHKAPFDALVQILDGEAEIVIDDKAFKLKKGESIIMPANIMHAVNAHQSFKMLLSLIKSVD
ncbi:MAG: cupin domain-containing protein [Bacteroidota bacterium]